MQSIMQSEKYCYLCNTFYHQLNYRNLEKHHCLNGVGKRTTCDKEGLWVWLCEEHHRTGKDAVHLNADIMKKMKQIAQATYEAKGGSRQSFIEKFGKNYL